MSKYDSFPRIEIDYLPTLELVTAAAAASTLWKSEAFQEPGLESQREEFLAWRSRVEAELSPFEQSDLDLVFSTVTAAIFLFYLVVWQELRSADELIRALGEMDEKEFLNWFRAVLKLETEEPWLTESAIEAAIEQDRAREPLEFKEEAARLVRLLSAPDEYRQRMAAALDLFYRRFLEEQIEGLEQEVREKILAYEPQFREKPEVSLDLLSGGNYESLLAGRERLTLFITRLAAFERSILLPGEAYMVVGTGLLESSLFPTTDQRAVEERTDELLKTLSDPSRLAILRLLSRRPRYGKELARELEIAAPTASYHLDKLMRSNLVRLELPQGRRFYYSVNPKGIEELRECLEQEFLGKGE